MKNRLILLASFFFFCRDRNAASGAADFSKIPPERIFGWTLLKTGGGWPCDPGAIWLNAGTSFGLLNYPTAHIQSSIMPVQLSADYSFSSHFAAGIYTGFNQLTFSDWGIGYSSRLRSIKFGGRFLVHGSDLLCDAFGFHFDSRAIDLYAGVSAGVDRRNWAYRYRGNPSFAYEDISHTTGHLGLFLGVRYIFKQRAGVFLEAGRGNFGILHAGFSFKIR